MNHYEIVILVHPDRVDQVDAMLERYVSMIEKGSGKIYRNENWGRQSLAYPIEKLTKAIYLLLNVECNSDVLHELQKLFRFSDSVMRFLIIRMDKAISETSLFLKRKQLQESSEVENNSELSDDPLLAPITERI